MTKIEKIQNLLDGVEADVRKATVADVIDTLKRFTADVPESERPGLLAAIEIIQANY